MKSAVIAPVLLALTALIQALGMHQYQQSAITVTGHLFFTIFLAGIGIFYGRRGRGEAFSTVRLALLALGAVALVLTLVGWGMTLFWFYPSIWMFYGSFLLLLVTAVLAVASNPTPRQREAELETGLEADTGVAPGVGPEAEARIERRPGAQGDVDGR